MWWFLLLAVLVVLILCGIAIAMLYFNRKSIPILAIKTTPFIVSDTTMPFTAVTVTSTTPSVTTAPITTPPVTIATLTTPTNYTNPVIDRDYPDPCVQVFGSIAYAYATNGNGSNVQLSTSTDELT